MNVIYIAVLVDGLVDMGEGSMEKYNDLDSIISTGLENKQHVVIKDMHVNERNMPNL